MSSRSVRVEIRRQAPPARPAARAGSIFRDLDGRVCGRAFVGTTDSWLEWDGLGLCRLNRESGAVQLWPDPALPPDEISRIFFHDVQPILLQALGAEALHASAVLGPFGAVAFCGSSGAGKSTLAYALARGGWTQIADDHLAIEVDGGTPYVRPLSFQPKLRPPTLQQFGASTGRERQVDMERAPLAAVFLVEQQPSLSAPCAITPVPAASAFTALLPHAHCFDPHDRRETDRLVTDYLSLVEHVPVHRVAYRPSFGDIDALLAAIQTCASSRPPGERAA
jgi:hypothetical protein